ncbi:hypothetical protein G6F63_016980 [Rhizopus arrhizus]|nr:hypothetical protein G6F63_016980 [Rhizopus arrhizus]
MLAQTRRAADQQAVAEAISIERSHGLLERALLPWRERTHAPSPSCSQRSTRATTSAATRSCTWPASISAKR